MSNPTQSDPPPTLLTLPRELRDEIYGHLVLPPQVFVTCPALETQKLQRREIPALDASLDSRILLPARPSTNILHICKQVREEYLELIARHTDSRAHHVPFSVAEAFPGRLPEERYVSDAVAERERDDGLARITMEIMRPVRANMGSYYPKREQPSDGFMALLPLLSRLKKIRIIVWTGSDWWYGPPEERRRRTENVLKRRLKRTSPGQSDQVQPNNQAEEQGDIVRPDPLAVALGSLMTHLPLVEEIHVDVMMLAYFYHNLDLPDVRWEYVKGWLDGPIFPPDGRRLKKVHRRLIASDTLIPIHAGTFYHKLETWDDTPGDGAGRLVHVSEGSTELPDAWDETPDDPAFTNVYDRLEPLAD